MIDDLEALLALSEHRRVSAAAVHLNISQPTLSKRLAALQSSLGRTLLEHQGRNVVLTPYAEQLIARVRPLLSELRYALAAESLESEARLSLAVSLAIMDSWGAEIIARAKKRLANMHIDMRTSHSSLALLSVRSGESMLALAYGQAENTPDLLARPLLEEPIVIIPSGLKRMSWSRKKELAIISIEANSETWTILERRLARFTSREGIETVVEKRVQTFSAVAQMALAGFGHGLVTLGIARALRIPESHLLHFPKPGLSVPVSIIGRKTTLERSMIKKFCDTLQDEAQKKKIGSLTSGKHT